MNSVLNGPLRVDSLHNRDSAESLLLDDLQGNIVKGHRCPFAAHLFVTFRDGLDARQCLREIVISGRPLAISRASDQTAKIAWLSGGGQASDRPFLSIMLSHQGYQKLKINVAEIPRDAAFRYGMQVRGPAWLGDDQSFREWESHFRQIGADGELKEGSTIDAMIMLAGHDRERLSTCRDLLEDHLKSRGIVSIGCEMGSQLFDKDKHRPIEHFGYVDNISSPVFLDRGFEPPRHWNALTPLGAVLEKCMGGGEASYGSYVVFRKLEQNVRRFEQLERDLAVRLCLKGSDASERAGELIIGRRKDGQPTVEHEGINDFDFRSDADGIRCPFAAHIRKMNPRGSTDPTRDKDQALAQERLHIIVRRGVTYGARPDLQPGAEPSRPESGVGMLFICYQRSIEQQFEHLQHEWANSYTFPPSGPQHAGRDLLIGRGDPAVPAKLPTECGGGFAEQAVESCITVKGGEFFFAPSISFFRNL